MSEDYTLININGDTDNYAVENAVTIICDDEVDYSPVLSQVLTDPDQKATYVVSNKNTCEENETGERNNHAKGHYLLFSTKVAGNKFDDEAIKSTDPTL